MSVNVIELGNGDYVVNHGYYGDRAAIFIEPAPAPGTPGADASASGLSKTQCAHGGTVIVLGNLASAQALDDELALAIRRIGTR